MQSERIAASKQKQTAKQTSLAQTCISFDLSVYFSFCLKLHSRAEKTQQAQRKARPRQFNDTLRIQAQEKGALKLTTPLYTLYALTSIKNTPISQRLI